MKNILTMLLLLQLLGCDNRSIRLEADGQPEMELDIAVHTNNLTIPLDSTATIYIQLNGVGGCQMNYGNSSLGVLQDSAGQLVGQQAYLEGDTGFYYQPQLAGTHELAFTFMKPGNTGAERQLVFTVIP